MKRRQFAWEDQRFSSKDTMPLASKLILPEDTTEEALQISTTAGVFDQANESMIRQLHDLEAVKRERLHRAELEAVDEFAEAKRLLESSQALESSESSQASDDSEHSEAAEPDLKKQKVEKSYSLFAYSSSDSEPSFTY